MEMEQENLDGLVMEFLLMQLKENIDVSLRGALKLLQMKFPTANINTKYTRELLHRAKKEQVMAMTEAKREVYNRELGQTNRKGEGNQQEAENMKGKDCEVTAIRGEEGVSSTATTPSNNISCAPLPPFIEGRDIHPPNLEGLDNDALSRLKCLSSKWNSETNNQAIDMAKTALLHIPLDRLQAMLSDIWFLHGNMFSIYWLATPQDVRVRFLAYCSPTMPLTRSQAIALSGESVMQMALLIPEFNYFDLARIGQDEADDRLLVMLYIHANNQLEDLFNWTAPYICSILSRLPTPPSLSQEMQRNSNITAFKEDIDDEGTGGIKDNRGIMTSPAVKHYVNQRMVLVISELLLLMDEYMSALFGKRNMLLADRLHLSVQQPQRRRKKK